MTYARIGMRASMTMTNHDENHRIYELDDLTMHDRMIILHFREDEIPYLLEVYSGKHGDKIRVVHECPLYEYPYKACYNKEGTEKVACVRRVYPAVSNDKIGYVCVVESEYTRDYEMDSEISILACATSQVYVISAK